METSFKLSKKGLIIPLPKAYVTKNSKRIDMLMDTFREMHAENFQLKRTVMQLQNKVIALVSKAKTGCKRVPSNLTSY